MFWNSWKGARRWQIIPRDKKAVKESLVESLLKDADRLAEKLGMTMDELIETAEKVAERLLGKPTRPGKPRLYYRKPRILRERPILRRPEKYLL